MRRGVSFTLPTSQEVESKQRNDDLSGMHHIRTEIVPLDGVEQRGIERSLPAMASS